MRGMLAKFGLAGDRRRPPAAPAVLGVGETRAVRQWADGVREIRDRQVLDRFRLIYRAVRTLDVQESQQNIKTGSRG